MSSLPWISHATAWEESGWRNIIATLKSLLPRWVSFQLNEFWCFCLFIGLSLHQWIKCLGASDALGRYSVHFGTFTMRSERTTGIWETRVC
jgi:hypothetical protein